MNKGLFKFSVRDICEIAVMCALAIAIDQVLNVKVQANGGSVGIACLPLFIISYRHGWFKGFIASAIVYGFITCVFDGYGLITYPFDYFFAFGSIGIAGLFGKMIYRYVKEPGAKSKIISLLLILATVLIHGVIRFASSTISSVLVYHATLAAGIAYQATYVPATCAALVIFLYVLLPALLAINNQYPTAYLNGKTKKEAEQEQVNE
ncbi:MAG: energy-coupled thiamine transporter ThiT [Bacilli bacterium]|nr:energy-coupled thiamine transporter ThiT [Bacilli bacterium]